MDQAQQSRVRQEVGQPSHRRLSQRFQAHGSDYRGQAFTGSSGLNCFRGRFCIGQLGRGIARSQLPADQSEKDHDALTNAVRAGKLEAVIERE